MTHEARGFPRHFSWSFLKTFCMPGGESSFEWNAVQMMRAKTHAALVPATARYELLKQKWERRLRPLGGDPTALPFDDFHPLRLSREEDWSDWLHWLLKTSVTGAFAEVLFGQHINRGSSSFVKPEVKREELTEDRKRRADIVVTWKSGQKTDIEVKIQDWQVGKTFETAMKLSGQSPKSKWYHFILLPDERMPDWYARERDRADDEDIHAVPWGTVVSALRQCLWSGKESLVWRTWAWTFCAAIQKHILRLSEPGSLRSDDEGKLQMALSWLNLLDPTQKEKMEPAMKSFLEEGLTQYVKAKYTIAAFEDQVANLLKAAVAGREKQRWSPLSSVKWGRRASPGGGSGGDGYWISMYITGKSQRHGDAAIDCGLWWNSNAPNVSEPIIYADFYDKPKRVVNFSWDRNRKGVHSFEPWGRTHLYLPVPKSLELADPLNRLLDALLEQLR